MTMSVLIGLVTIGLCSATEIGKITFITFSGPQDPHHPNVVQVGIDSGYHVAGVNQDFAALRVSDDPATKQMISALFFAFSMNRTVQIELDPTDTYFQDRAIILRVTVNGE